MHNSNITHTSSSPLSESASALGFRVLVLDVELSEVGVCSGADLLSCLLDNAIALGAL